MKCKILFTTVFVALIMLMTPCISALNIQLTENTKMNKTTEELSESEFVTEKVNDQLNFDEKNIYEKSESDFGDILALLFWKFLGFTVLSAMIVGSVIPFPGAVEIFYIGIYGTIAALVGFGNGLEAGQPFLRAILGYRFTAQMLFCTFILGLRMLTYPLEDLGEIMDGPAFEEWQRLFDIVINGEPINQELLK